MEMRNYFVCHVLGMLCRRLELQLGDSYVDAYQQPFNVRSRSAPAFVCNRGPLPRGIARKSGGLVAARGIEVASWSIADPAYRASQEL